MSKIDEDLKTKFQSDRHRLLANVIFTSNMIRSDFNDFIAPFGLSSQQYNILRILRGAGKEVSMNDIKKLMIDKSPHTTRLTTKLLDKGYVARHRDEKDRRIVLVNITEKGLALLAEIDKADVNQVKYESRVTEEEARIASAILEKLRG